MIVLEELTKKIKMEILKDSPEMRDVEPVVEVKEISVHPEITNKLGVEEQAARKVYTFTFKRTIIAKDGAKLSLVSRITTDEEGNIIKKTGN